MDWGKLLKDERDSLILTQTEMAKRLGVSFASVNRWENHRCEPTTKIKRKIKTICIKEHLDFDSYFSDKEGSK